MKQQASIKLARNCCNLI